MLRVAPHTAECESIAKLSLRHGSIPKGIGPWDRKDRDMTDARAIAELTALRDWSDWMTDEQVEAIAEAISALEYRADK